jgi:hypothetical protein
MSAREDARLWRGVTGLGLLDADMEEGKQEEDGRRDIAIAVSVRSSRRIATPGRIWDPRRRLKARSCLW